MAKKKPSEGENSEEVTQAEIVEYAERALDAKDVSYGEVPLCKEYFFNQELVESDLSNICGAKDKVKSDAKKDPDPSEPGYPWTDVTFDGRKKSFSSWKGQTWCVGDDIDGDIYVTAAAGQYGIIEPGKTLPITRARQTLEILKKVAEGASRQEIEEAVETARLGKKKKTAVETVTTDTKKKVEKVTPASTSSGSETTVVDATGDHEREQ